MKKIPYFCTRMKDLSILIPTYNHECYPLVATLQRQAANLSSAYEIIVADDGSTDLATVQANRAINQLPHCRYMERTENVGRAAIRNLLANAAAYPWLLFIDSDMVIRHDDYVRRYADCPYETVVDGGITIGGDPKQLCSNLRYRYERAFAPHNAVQERQQHPYHDFHTANFLVRRDLMLTYPFDLRFRHYGYEDVLFGKQLQQHAITIHHIDNPVSFEHFEDNAHFLDKTEEGLRTLYQFRDELSGYSRLLDRSAALPHWPLRLAYRLMGTPLRHHLEHHPHLPLFTLYRLLYFAAISNLS